MTKMVTRDLTRDNKNCNKNSGNILVTFLEHSKNKQKLNDMLLDGNRMSLITYVYLCKVVWKFQTGIRLIFKKVVWDSPLIGCKGNKIFNN